MDYSYIAVSKEGTKQKGLIDANNEKEVLDYLRSISLTPLKIKNNDKKSSLSIGFKAKVKNADIVVFTRQLSSMIQTGLTLIESLEILKSQTTKASMKNMVNDLSQSISEGNSFSQSLENHKEAFSEVYIALIAASEKGGLLDKVLARLADNLEKSENLKKRVKSAMFYPMIVIGGVVIVISIMNIFVIPQLGKLYDSLNLALPLTTRIVLGFSKFTTTFFPLFIPIAFGISYLYRRFKKTEMGITTIDKTKLRLPVLGPILRLAVLDEITRTLSLLITSGTSIIEAITITSNVAGNVLYKKAIVHSGELVEKGVNLSVAMQNQNIFPPILIQMIKVGESTGKIDDSLLRMAEYFERDLDMRVKNLTTAIEPILIIVLGVSVAFLILSVITPIYSLISQIQ